MSSQDVPGQVRAALFRASPEFIAQLLQLPEGAVIDGVQEDVRYRGVLIFRIQGAGWLARPGDAITEARPVVTVKAAEAAPLIDWGFPEVTP